MWHMGDGWGWWMLGGSLMMVRFWVAVIWAVVALTRRPTEPPANRQPQREPTAMEVLERRYASGELTDEEFEAKKQRLTR